MPRVPVVPLKRKFHAPRQSAAERNTTREVVHRESAEDVLAAALIEAGLSIVRKKAFESTDSTGVKWNIVAEIAIPKSKVVVELDGPESQNDKNIIRNIHKEKAIRANGWAVLRFDQKDAMVETNSVVRRVKDFSNSRL